jgi:hypothetical protein
MELIDSFIIEFHEGSLRMEDPRCRCQDLADLNNCSKIGKEGDNFIPCPFEDWRL